MTRSVDTITLTKGAHQNSDSGLCAMEAVAWLANEPHSDRPKCASPVLASYVRTLNDRMPDDQRQRLKPYLTKLLNSRNPALDQKRVEVLAWASITEFAPTALHAIGLVDHAETLKNLKFGDWVGAKAAAYAAAYAAYAAANAADAAADAADAAADAAYAADAAADAADAAYAADAADAAADAADAAADAADAAPNGDVWDLALAALDRALEVKEAT